MVTNQQSATVIWNGNPAWFVGVNKQWAHDNWNSILTQSNALAFVQSCHGNDKTGGTSFLTCCGGGVGFGYPGDSWSSPPNIQVNNNALLKRMNGKVDDGEFRSAGEAFNNMTRLDNFEIEGNQNITLCPSIEKYYPKDEENVANSGTGYFQVDTYCRNNVPANEALTFDTEGNVTIDNIHWVGSGQVNRIGYDWNGTGDFKVTVTVHYDKFQSWGATTAISHVLDYDSIAPNTEDGECYFTGGVEVAFVIDDYGSWMRKSKELKMHYLNILEPMIPMIKPYSNLQHLRTIIRLGNQQLI